MTDKDESEYLFSKELRDVLKPFEKMDIRDCIKSAAFCRTLGKHAGMTDEQLDSILNGKR